MTTATKSAVPALNFKPYEAPEGIKASPAVLGIAGRINQELTDIEAGGKLPDDIVESVLPEGKTMADLKWADGFVTDFHSALGLVVSQRSVERMKKEKNLQSYGVDVMIGKNKLSHNVDRTRMVPDGNGGQVEKFGLHSASYKFNGVGNSRGLFAKTRQNTSKMATEIFGAKK